MSGVAAGAGSVAVPRPSTRSPPTATCSRTSTVARPWRGNRARRPPSTRGGLRRAGMSGLALDFLAADYGLARFGGVALTPAEHRRAVARFAGLRRRLMAVPIVSPATDDDAEAPTGEARP